MTERPPPEDALRCPNGHTEVAVREEWFFCRGCADRRPGHDGRYRVIVDKRGDRPISHGAFVDRWGADYTRRRI